MSTNFFPDLPWGWGEGMWPTFDDHAYCCGLPGGSRWEEGSRPGRYTQNLMQWIPSALLHQQGRGASPRGQLPSQSQLLLTSSTEMILASQSMVPNIPTIPNPAVEGLTILWTSQYMQLPFRPQSRPTGVTCLKLRLVLCTPDAMKLTWLRTAATLKKL